ncbi:hypothetical protein CF319_g4019 [Tilletia indica]|nr:hypothetical protein CF319_g4019 [Tilletia indica]
MASNESGIPTTNASGANRTIASMVTDDTSFSAILEPVATTSPSVVNAVFPNMISDQPEEAPLSRTPRPPTPFSQGTQAEESRSPTQPLPSSPAAGPSSPVAGVARALLELSLPAVSGQAPPIAASAQTSLPMLTLTASAIAPPPQNKPSEAKIQEQVRQRLVKNTQALIERIRREPTRAEDLIGQAYTDVPLGIVDRLATSFAMIAEGSGTTSASMEMGLGVDEDFRFTRFRPNPSGRSSTSTTAPANMEFPAIPTDSEGGSDGEDDDSRYHVDLEHAANISVLRKKAATATATKKPAKATFDIVPSSSVTAASRAPGSSSSKATGTPAAISSKRRRSSSVSSLTPVSDKKVGSEAEDNTAKRQRTVAEGGGTVRTAKATRTGKEGGFMQQLNAGNIPEVWHKPLGIIYDILTFGPLSPQDIVDAALARVRPLQTDMQGTSSQFSRDGDLLSTLNRLERQDDAAGSLQIRILIDNMSLWAMERQARVDVAFRKSSAASNALDEVKCVWIPKIGGAFGKDDSNLIKTLRDMDAANIIRDTASTSAPSQGSAANLPEERRKSRKKQHLGLNPHEEARVVIVNKLLKHQLRCGRLWAQTGATLGSVIFIPLLVLSNELRTIDNLRRISADTFSALMALLRGGKPVPVSGGPEFTERDEEIVEAITFGVRGFLPRVLNQALAIADALSPWEDGSSTPYLDVLVVRQASDHPVLGVEEPSVVQTPLSSPTQGAGQLRRVYGLEIPGSHGQAEVMTRTPAFIAGNWRQLMRANQGTVSLDTAIPPSANDPPSTPPLPFGIDFADRRMCHLAGCDPADVLPYAVPYAKLFGLDLASEEFIELRDSIENRRRLVRPFTPPATLHHLDEKVSERNAQALTRRFPTSSSLAFPSLPNPLPGPSSLPTLPPPPPLLPPPPPLPPQRPTSTMPEETPAPQRPPSSNPPSVPEPASEPQ